MERAIRTSPPLPKNDDSSEPFIQLDEVTERNAPKQKLSWWFLLPLGITVGLVVLMAIRALD